MMEAIKQWCFSLCTAMVACGIMQMLMPNSSLEKVFRLTVSVFFLCVMLSPVLLQSPQLRIEVEEYSIQNIRMRAERLSTLMESQTDTAARQNIRKIIEEKLSEMGINCHSITIDIITKGQNIGQSFFADISLYGEDQNRNEEILRELRDLLGIDIRLKYE